MITEETIKQTRFFKHIDGGFFLVREIKTVTQVRMVNCQDGGEFRTILGGEDCKEFAPVDVSFKSFVQNQVTAQLPPTRPRDRGPIQSKPNRTVRDKVNKKTSSGGKISKRKKSQYKGVSPLKPLKSGKIKYQAVCWDGKNKKCVTIGTYETELEAADAYRDYTGDKAEAAKLRAQAKQQQADMVEQAQNNPARPTAAGRKKKTRMIYVCKRCGLEWQTRPKYCPASNCGNDDFREVPKE